MSATFTINDPHVIVVGKKIDGRWFYMKSQPMPYWMAADSVKAFQPMINETQVAYARPVHDPEVQDMPVSHEVMAHQPIPRGDEA